MSGCRVPLSTPFTSVLCKIILFSACSSVPPCPYNSVELSAVIECCWKSLNRFKRKSGGCEEGTVEENKEGAHPVSLLEAVSTVMSIMGVSLLIITEGLEQHIHCVTFSFVWKMLRGREQIPFCVCMEATQLYFTTSCSCEKLSQPAGHTKLQTVVHP